MCRHLYSFLLSLGSRIHSLLVKGPGRKKYFGSFFAPSLILSMIVAGAFLTLETRHASAACITIGDTEYCSGIVPSAIFTAPPITTLNVDTLSQDVSSVALTGVGSLPGSGTSSHYSCSTGNPSDCNFGTDPGTGEQTCSPVASGASCVQSGPASGGPTGNAGPRVTVNVVTGQFSVTPGGAASNGISAAVQGVSHGSDGGAGGDAYLFGNAGNGGAGANGGLVSVTLNGNAATSADNTPGVAALSLAGNGGSAYVAGGSSGNGGAGGFGGDATAQLTRGAISTTGANSVGIGAISQGCNGGSGGGGGGIVYSAGADVAGQAGGATVITGAGASIETSGNYAYGIQARSLGGGGGSGFGLFYSGGSNGSTGGSGGNGGTVGSIFAFGGNGGSGADGGDATVINSGAIETGTHGLDSINSAGILAQSIGGGGCNGGGSIAVGTGISAAFGGTGAGGGNGGFAVSAAADLLSVAIGVAGTGGYGGAGGGDGGSAVANSAGTVETHGDQSVGILAQSVGGGGGGGNGGAVTVTNNGAIQVNGDNSLGIMAQSVGGGGGTAGSALGATEASVSIGGQNGVVGTGGDVRVVNSGSITITGNNSIGIFAQSVGGGGGLVFPGGDGADSVVLQSGGNGNGGAVTIDNTAGSITVNIMNASSTQPSLIEGGSGQGVGVHFLNGANNRLNNDGIITTVQGIDGFAVRGDTGDDQIINNGLVVGSLDLADGANSFNNKPNAVFASGVTVNLGQGNSLTNEGLLSPGDFQRVLTTNLTGNFIQTASGVYGVDLDLKNHIADRVDVAGSAVVSGTVAVSLLDPLHAPETALPGSHEVVIFSATGGETIDGLTLQAPSTAVATYSLVYPKTAGIALKYDIDYSPAGLTHNRHAVGDAINQIQLAQVSPSFGPIAAALFYQPDTAALGKVYDSLSGEGTAAAQQTAFWANDLFLSSVARRTAKRTARLTRGTWQPMERYVLRVFTPPASLRTIPSPMT